MIVLGIDPGTRLVGFAVVEGDAGSRSAKRILSLTLDCRSSKLKTAEKLRFITKRISLKLAELKHSQYQINIISLEKTFHGCNPQTTLRLGEVRGAILLTLASYNVIDIQATTVKKLIAGKGNASKDAVRKAALNLIGEPNLEIGYDEADAIAIALAGLYKAGEQK